MFLCQGRVGVGEGVGRCGGGLLRRLRHLARTMRTSRTSVTPACLRCARLTFTVTASYNRTNHTSFVDLYDLSPGRSDTTTRGLFDGTLRAYGNSVRLKDIFRLTRVYKIEITPSRGGTSTSTTSTNPFFSRAYICLL